MVDHFEILSTLERTDDETVYEARRREDDLPVTLSVRHEADPGFRAGEPAWLDGELDHPNILQVVDHGETEGKPFLATAWHEGRTLDALLWDQGQIQDETGDYPPDWAAHVHAMIEAFADVAGGLDMAHRREVFHGGIGPWSLTWVEDEQRLLLGGFDAEASREVARESEDGEPGEEAFYLAPERLRDPEAPPSVREDIYALGACLFEAVTLDLPYRAPNVRLYVRKVITGESEPSKPVHPSIPRGLMRILAGCLARDPEQRYESAAAVRAELLELLEEPQAPAAAAEQGSRGSAAEAAGSAGPLAWAGRAAVLLLLLASLVQGMRHVRTAEPVLAEGGGPAGELVARSAEAGRERGFEPSSGSADPDGASEAEILPPYASDATVEDPGGNGDEPGEDGALAGATEESDDDSAGDADDSDGGAAADDPGIEPRTAPKQINRPDDDEVDLISDAPMSVADASSVRDMGESLSDAQADPFALSAPDIEQTGMYGVVCRPGTRDPVDGWMVVVADGEGFEHESSASRDGGQFNIPVPPGARYDPVALVDGRGRRIKLSGSGLGARIWSGRNFELNLCGSASAGVVEGGGKEAPYVDPFESRETPAITGFYGVVFAPGTERPGAGYRTIVADADDREFVSEPSGEDGTYQVRLSKRGLYTPVAVLTPDGTRRRVVGMGSGVRIVEGRAVRFDYRRFE
ncbi:hypothetical protein ABI59_10590 [Acidobacteria bacterium Mor1]|nr:hypothetical protein ABI59_10590 [Acidobacteria bacterium Mor1]